MLENWFEQVNLFLATHPEWVFHLAFLLRLKCWLLTLLMGYFLFLIYREQLAKVREKVNAGNRLEA